MKPMMKIVLTARRKLGKAKKIKIKIKKSRNKTLAASMVEAISRCLKTTHRRLLPGGSITPRVIGGSCEDDGSHHTQRKVVHASARVGHAPACGG